jgi:hypothetical protein
VLGLHEAVPFGAGPPGLALFQWIRFFGGKPMSAQPLPMILRPRPRRSWIVWLLIFAMLLVCIPFIGIFGVHFYNRNRDTRLLANAIAETDQLDPGWRLDDILKGRENVPSDRNAALIVLQASALMPPKWSLPEELNDLAQVPPQYQLRPEAIAALEKAIKPLKPMAEKLRAAAPLATGQFVVQWDPSMIVPVPHVDHLRRMAIALQSSALLDAQYRRLEEACGNALAILALARSVGDEPFPTSQLVRCSLRGNAVSTIERCLGQGKVSDDLLADVQKHFAEEAGKPLTRLAGRGERAMLSQLFTNLGSGLISEAGMAKQYHMASAKGPQAGPAFLHEGGTYDLQHAWVLQHMNKMQKAIELDPVERVAEFKRLDDEMKNAPGALLHWIIVAPRMAMVPETDVRSSVNLELAVAGIGVERYRQKFARWPETLDEVVQAKLLDRVPVDPFDRKPVRFRKTADGVVLYSIGPDGKGAGTAWDTPDPVSPRYEFRLWNEDQRRQAPKPKR